MRKAQEMDGLGMTSRWVAALRERETLRPDRLFEDPFAGALAGDDGRMMCSMVESELHTLSGNRGLAVRTRFLDDFLERAMASGLRQVVILAAGMDARAFRLKWPTGTVIYEVERPEVLAYKEDVLAAMGARSNAERRLVTVDLRDDFAAAMRQAGFVPAEPSVFLVEGLLVYMPDELAVHRILQVVASLSAVGSRIGLDVVGTSFLALPVLIPLRERLAATGARWSFGTDDPHKLLAENGFSEVRAVESRHTPYDRGPPGAAPNPESVLTGDSYFLVTAERH